MKSAYYNPATDQVVIAISGRVHEDDRHALRRDGYRRDKQACTEDTTVFAKKYTPNAICAAASIVGLACTGDRIDTDRIPVLAIPKDHAQTAEAKGQQAASLRNSASGMHSSAMNLAGRSAEPIKIGHHSESRHRRDRKKVDSLMRTSAKAEHAAQRLTWQAQNAEARDRLQHNPEFIAGKIKNIETRIRSIRRSWHEHKHLYLWEWAADQQIKYFRTLIAAHGG
jgi:hypothetical protein